MSLADRIRRAVLGPTPEDTNQQVLTAGAPRHPIPTITNIPPTGLTTIEPALIIAAARQGAPVPDARDQQIPMPATRRLPPEERPDRPIDPLTDSGVHHAPETPGVRVACAHCGGSGYVNRTISELLRQSLGLIGDNGDQIVATFYRRLLVPTEEELAAAKNDDPIAKRDIASKRALAVLFPKDIVSAAHGSGDPGALQRDRLLGALAALAELYGTTPDDRQRLNTSLRAFGRHHAAFARPDGTVSGATPEEYLAVRAALFDTLHEAAGDAWQPSYDLAWTEAYNYAMVTMLHEQYNSNMTMPRYPRNPQ